MAVTLSRLLPFLIAPTVSACMLFVSFEDREPEEDDADSAAPDATPSSSSTTPRPPATATSTPDSGTPPFSCTGSVNRDVPGKPTKMCCNGVEVDITSATNCGGCAITCGAGQTCTLHANYKYYCTGCGNTGGRASCWSGCCSAKYGAIGICAPNDCDTGSCVQSNCTSRGMVCVEATTDSASYCAFSQ